MPEPILRIEHLWKRFGGIYPTADLSLEVEADSLHAVIGPNGAGKSTLVKQISGEVRPDAGKILFRGAEIGNAPAHMRARLGIARSFQITNLIRSFTALENVAFAVQSRHVSRMRCWGDAAANSQLNDEAAGYLRMVGLHARKNAKVAHLSYGEQRRLEVAIALSLKPQLILLDEPLAGIGAEEGRVMIELLRSVKGSVTILLVEHDMDAVFSLADRITVLVDGKSISAGSPDEIRDDPSVQAAYLGRSAASA